MKLGRHVIIATMAMVLLCGCKKSADDQAAENTQATEQSAITPAEEQPVTETAPQAGEATPVTAATFDINSVKVSTAQLGAFPYFSLPQGYAHGGGEQTIDFGAFPFWTGNGFENVEGRIYMSGIGAAEGKTYSRLEVQRNLENLIFGVGGVKVTESRIPNAESEKLGDDVKVGMILGLGDIYNDPTTTYVIRREDSNIWIHFVSNTLFGSLTIAQTEAFKPTATLIPADALKTQIATTGKAVIQVNFATDKADILPESQAQIDAVLALLQQDPTLRLSVEGHTDNTGDAAKNMTLSEARAKSVVTALIGKSIAADRLQAKGLGQDKPIADNATEEGRAKNRRVELVKL